MKFISIINYKAPSLIIIWMVFPDIFLFQLFKNSFSNLTYSWHKNTYILIHCMCGQNCSIKLLLILHLNCLPTLDQQIPQVIKVYANKAKINFPRIVHKNIMLVCYCIVTISFVTVTSKMEIMTYKLKLQWSKWIYF